MAKITPQEALNRVGSQQGIRLAPTKGKTARTEFIRALGMDDEIYLFSKGDGGMILPGDDALIPILGESDSADYTQPLPPCLNDWLAEYADEVNWWQNVGAGISSQAAAPQADAQTAELTEDISPLIRSTWAQQAPYNQNLTIDGKKCLVGCVPVSIGQVMLFWARKGYTRGCMATPAYISATNLSEIPALPPVTVFDFDAMTYTKPNTVAAKKAVADLLEHIGKAVRADYTPTGTGAFPAIYTEAMKTILRLGANIRIVRCATIGLANFEAAILNDLTEGKPVMMGGYKTTGGGHSFICDGYRESDKKFHFNWGWGGSYNGYYAMTSLNPTAVNIYNSNKMAIIGIQPDYKLGDTNGDGKVNVTDAMTIVSAANSGQGTERTDVNSDGKTNVADVMIVVNNVLGKNKL